MNMRLLKHLGVVAALVGSAALSSVSNAAIVNGSQLTFQGLATIASANSIIPSGTGEIQLATGSLSFAGYNSPNPTSVPGFTNALGNYLVTLGNFGAIGAFPSVLTLPALAAGDAGTPFAGGTFSILSTVNLSVAGFMNLVSTGSFLEVGNASPYAATMFFTVANFQPSASALQGYTGTLSVAASVIPVPGAMWIFGSGLLLMTAVMRRKAK